MIPKNGYLKTTLANVPYLLPYGQNITDHKRSILLNQSGSLLWDAVCRGADMDELLTLLAQEFGARESDLPRLRQDIEQYLHMLREQGLLSTFTAEASPLTSFDSEQTLQISSKITSQLLYMQIGPLKIAMDCPSSFLQEFFHEFSCDIGDADQTILFVYDLPSFRTSGNILVQNNEIIIYDSGVCYVFLYPNNTIIHEMHVTKDGSLAHLYCKSGFEREGAETVFHALRFAFLILAQQRELYVLHSASLLYKGKAWLFSGRSGAGKSTHTNLWSKLLNTPILNGDLNMVGIENSSPYVYGLPWCGTSGIRTKTQYPLGGVMLVKQAMEDIVITPPPNEQILSLIHRMISPAWTADLLQKNVNFAEALAELAPVFCLFCTKSPSAVHTAKAAIDDFNEKETYQ